VATRDQIVEHEASTPDSIERAVGELSRISGAYQQQFSSVVDVDLVVGANRINHNLGRRPGHVSVMPTTADATFAWAVTSTDDRQIVITVVGVAQTGASVEIS
jgi:hypothetical protein